MNSILAKAAKSALNLLMPMTCAVCENEGRLVCESCEAALPSLKMPFCSRCADPGEALCDPCAISPLDIDGIRAPYIMSSPVSDMIHDFKYRNLRAAAPGLGNLLSSYLENLPIAAGVIIPVPLHSKRLRERGYNQAELLARQLSKRIQLPVDSKSLRRAKNTPPQVSMTSRAQRIRNIQGAFECASNLNGKRVLLIDDVVTSGSTMSACARELKSAGASEVWGIALAR